MATKVEAAHLMMVNAARLKDAGERNDVEAGMAKFLASEFGKEVVEQTPSASTAATATPRSTRSSGSTATRRCC